MILEECWAFFQFTNQIRLRNNQRNQILKMNSYNILQAL
jgi:hypothetical protein